MWGVIQCRVGSTRRDCPTAAHRLAEAGSVVEPDLAASAADGDDAACRATCEVITRLDAKKQGGPECRDGSDMLALDTGYRIRPCAPVATGTGHRSCHVRVSSGLDLLGRHQFI